MLVGGSPSIKQQPLELLARRGILTAAMNNAALHFHPTLWMSCDNPECYDPSILMDPGIMKFGSSFYEGVPIGNGYNEKFNTMPNMYFYTPVDGVPWDEYLEPRGRVPWYNNTLFVSICILYNLGVRRIVLAGSDLSIGPDASMYAHPTDLGDPQKKWNKDLYDSLAYELRRMKPIFDHAGMELYDCSVNSRISSVYRHLAFDRAVDLCLAGFPETPVDPTKLPHCSKFASTPIQEQVAKWPGYRMVGGTTN